MTRVVQILRDHWQMILLTTAVYLLWSTDVIWPLRVLIVLFHELAHAGVALATGGEVLELSVNRREGGFVRYRGGNFFWTATAGYLGSLLIGMGLLVAAVLSDWDRAVMTALGGIIMITVLLFVRDGFAILYMSAMGLALIGAGIWLPQVISDLFLRIVGLVSMLYVPWDIFSDTIQPRMRTTSAVSDAEAIANRYGLTEGIVGGVWAVIAVALIVYVLRLTLRQSSNVALSAFKGR